MKRQRVGSFQGCFAESKWGGARKRDKWDLLMGTAPNIAKRYDELPNWIRQALGVQTKKGKAEDAGLPPRIAEVVEAVLIEHIEAGEEVYSSTIGELLSTVIRQYNAEVDDVNDESAKHNAGVCEELELAGGGSDVDRALLKMLPKCEASTHPRAIDTFSRRFADRFGFGVYRQEKPGKHLPYHHPQLQKIREFVDHVTSTGEVHERLVLNFDQVWTVLFEPSPKILFKSADKAGQRADKLQSSVRKRQVFLSKQRQKERETPLRIHHSPFPLDSLTYIHM